MTMSSAGVWFLPDSWISLYESISSNFSMGLSYRASGICAQSLYYDSGFSPCPIQHLRGEKTFMLKLMASPAPLYVNHQGLLDWPAITFIMRRQAAVCHLLWRPKWEFQLSNNSILWMRSGLILASLLMGFGTISCESDSVTPSRKGIFPHSQLSEGHRISKL